MRALSNNRAGLKESGLVLLLLLPFFLGGCNVIEVPAPKQFDCGDWNEAQNEWYCQSRVTGKCIKNQYVDSQECDAIEKGETNE